MDKEVYDALYKDIVCKSYCSIEVPSEVLELQQKEGISFLSALRQVMKRRIREYAEGGDKISADQLKEILDDLDGSVNIRDTKHSINLRRIYAAAYRDVGGEDDLPYRKTQRVTNLQLNEWSEIFDIEVKLSGKSQSRYAADIVIAHLKKQKKILSKILEEVNE